MHIGIMNALKSLVTIRMNEISCVALVTAKSLFFLFGNRDRDKHKLCERKRTIFSKSDIYDQF